MATPPVETTPYTESLDEIAHAISQALGANAAIEVREEGVVAGYHWDPEHKGPRRWSAARIWGRS